MDGDWSRLKEITQLSEKHEIITILDDAHGDFVLGKDGKGTANFFNVEKGTSLGFTYRAIGKPSHSEYYIFNNILI